MWAWNYLLSFGEGSSLPGPLQHQVYRERDDVVHHGDDFDRTDRRLHQEAFHAAGEGKIREN